MYEKSLELIDKLASLESELIYFSNTCEHCREFDRLILSILSVREAHEHFLAFVMKCQDKEVQDEKHNLKQCVCRH